MPRHKTPGNGKRKAYLTKRALVRATGKATRFISSEAMNIKGFIVKAENEWVVKIYNTGQRERLSRLDHSAPVVLD